MDTFPKKTHSLNLFLGIVVLMTILIGGSTIAQEGPLITCVLLDSDICWVEHDCPFCGGVDTCSANYWLDSVIISHISANKPNPSGYNVQPTTVVCATNGACEQTTTPCSGEFRCVRDPVPEWTTNQNGVEVIGTCEGC